MIQLLCPQCKAPLHRETAACTSGHQFVLEDGVHHLIHGTVEEQLDAFLSAFNDFRAEDYLLLNDPTYYDQLPFVEVDKAVWKLRQYDVQLLDELMEKRTPQTVLDFGAWNCWLSHHLAKQGHEVLAIDYFIHPFDGLRAKQHYSFNDWWAVQMDLEDVSIIDASFDVIVLNRNFSYFTDPLRSLQQVKAMLKPGGLLVLTGLNIFHNTTSIAQHYEKLKKDFQQRYGIPFLFKPFKGYLDAEDQQQLEQAGVKIHAYAQLWKGNLKAKLVPQQPRYYYGIYRNQQ